MSASHGFPFFSRKKSKGSFFSLSPPPVFSSSVSLFLYGKFHHLCYPGFFLTASFPPAAQENMTGFFDRREPGKQEKDAKIFRQQQLRKKEQQANQQFYGNFPYTFELNSFMFSRKKEHLKLHSVILRTAKALRQGGENSTLVFTDSTEIPGKKAGKNGRKTVEERGGIFSLSLSFCSNPAHSEIRRKREEREKKKKEQTVSSQIPVSTIDPNTVHIKSVLMWTLLVLFFLLFF